jgi:hypothetical protein
MMKGTGNNYTIPPLYNGSTGELVYEDKAKADHLNQNICSITSINDSNRDGNLQVRKDYLNRILRGKHIVSEVAFSIWWLIPSSPQALPI